MPPAEGVPRPAGGPGASWGTWTDLWPAPPAGRAWTDLRGDDRQALLVQDWQARWPAVPFPVSPAYCPVCRRLRVALAAPLATRGALGRVPDAADAWEDHRALHALLVHELVALWASRADATATAQADRARAIFGTPAAAGALLAEPVLAPFARPSWDAGDGRPVLREPDESTGSTERSKAFLLLHRHRFGRFRSATMRDFEQVYRSPRPAPGPLRLYDDGGRVLELGGMTAGYGGEGPRGAVWALRVAGLPEGDRGPSGPTELERTVLGQRAFIWPPARPAAGR
jgi:hypothetical protein